MSLSNHERRIVRFLKVTLEIWNLTVAQQIVGAIRVPGNKFFAKLHQSAHKFNVTAIRCDALIHAVLWRNDAKCYAWTACMDSWPIYCRGCCDWCERFDTCVSNFGHRTLLQIIFLLLFLKDRFLEICHATFGFICSINHSRDIWSLRFWYALSCESNSNEPFRRNISWILHCLETNCARLFSSKGTP